MLKYLDQDELCYIAQPTDEEGDYWLDQLTAAQLDFMVDCCGMIFKLSTEIQGEIKSQPTGKKIELDVAIALVQAHYALLGSCCVAKITATSISELIYFVGVSED
jgi:hypothetical protein